LPVDRYQVDQWDTADGLPSNTIHAIAQTPGGYLWVATYKGLVRFDGISFTPVHFAYEVEKWTGQTALPEALYLDKNQVLWIGSSIGLTSYDYRTRRFETYTPATSHGGLPAGSIRRIFQDREGNLWLGFVSRSLCKFSPANGSFTAYGPKDGLTGATIHGIVEDIDGRLLVGTREKGVFKYVDGTFTRVPIPGMQGYLVSMYMDIHGSLWLCTSQGLIRKTPRAVEFYTAAHGLPGNHTTAVLEENKDYLWLGTVYGLTRLSGKPGERLHFRAPFTLTASVIVCLFKDREGSVWAGTLESGLKRLKPGRFRSFTPLESRSREVIFSMFRESGGTTLLGTATGKLFRIDDKRRLERVPGPELPGTGISAIYRDTRGTPWLATNGEGVFQFKNNRFVRYKKKDGLSHNLVTTIFEDSRGNLWFGTHNGVSAWERVSGRFFALTPGDGLPGAKVHHIHEDQTMDIWIACDKGIAVLGGGIIPGGGEKPRLTYYLKGITVTWIYEDSSPPPGEGPLFWLATNGAGLKRLKLKDRQITAYTVKHGLPTPFLYRFFEDQQGFFWFQSDSGILRVNKFELNRFAAGETGRIDCISFDRSDGIDNPEFNNPFPRHSAFRTQNGELWFLNKKEIVIVNPAGIRLNKHEPPVVIDEARFNGQSLSLPPAGRPATFMDVTDIRFRFTAASLLSSKRIVFRYRLKGKQNDWVYLPTGKERSAGYSGLAYGAYTFEVSARNADGVWNTTGTSVSFTIKPSFFKSTIFKILLLAVLLVVTVLVLYLVKVRKKRLQSKGPAGEDGTQEEHAGDEGAPKHHLHPDFVQATEKKLMHLVEVEKVYRDEMLTLPILAEKLSIQRYQLSQILNDHLKRHFNDFINYYRIEEAKAIMAGPAGRDKSNKQIAIEVGFNTDTAFYSAFKKFTGKTPRHYRQECEKD
jgi:ligand-binding sensor domain-containing protein/AraC-like DNA-binding protein